MKALLRGTAADGVARSLAACRRAGATASDTVPAAVAAAVLAACLAALVLSGCAAQDAPEATGQSRGAARPAWAEALTPQAAMEKLTAGRSSRAEVLAALGPAIVIPFDSGYQVWVYRWPGGNGNGNGNAGVRAATELVLLFKPDGPVAKMRLRPGYPPP